MRRFLTAALLLALLPLPASALDVGAPVRTLDQGKLALAGGFRYLDFEVDDVDCSSRAFGGKVAFGAAPGVTPYLKIGFADLSYGGADGSLGFSWGVGTLLRVMPSPSPEGLELAVDLQAAGWESEDANPLSLQAALLASMRSAGTNTYAGAALTSTDPDSGAGSETYVSLLFGIDYFIDYNFFLGAEAHLFGEDSLSFSVGYQF